MSTALREDSRRMKSREWQEEFQGWKAMRTSQFRQKQMKHRSASPCIDTATTTASSPYLGPQDKRDTSHPLVVVETMAPSRSCLTPENRDDDRLLRPLGVDSPIPDQYFTYIQQAFGTKDSPVVDLYMDVLQVSRNAADRDIRIAYFKRGRDVLSLRVSELKNDAQAKKRFQAVCMAYEILSTPELRTFYDQYGLVSPSSSQSEPLSVAAPKHVLSKSHSRRSQRDATSSQEPSEKTSPLRQPQTLRSQSKPKLIPPQETAAAKPTPEGPPAPSVVTPVLRGRQDQRDLRSASTRSRSRSMSRIRWNEEVEELLYQKDPQELLGTRSSSATQSTAEAALGVILGTPPAETKAPKQLQKVKQKSILEAQELDRQLVALQKGKKGDTFVSYILDDLEAGLDGLEARVEEFVRFAIASGSENKKKSQQEEDAGTSPHHPDESTMRSDGATTMSTTGLEEEQQLADETSIRTEDFSPFQKRLSSLATASERSSNHVAVPELVSSGMRPPFTRVASTAAVELESNLDEETKTDPFGLQNAWTPSPNQPPPSSPREILAAFELPSNKSDDAESSRSSSFTGHTSMDPLLSEHASASKKSNAKPMARLSRFRRFSNKAKQNSAAAADDPAQSLFDDLTKPAPESVFGASDEGLPMMAYAAAADAPVDDTGAKELFRDLTKPPPSGYERDSEMKITALFNSKSKDRRRTDKYSKTHLDYDMAVAFDPFGVASDSGKSSRPRRPPDCIYSARASKDNDDEITYNTVSTMTETMSVPAATAVLRERLRAKGIGARKVEGNKGELRKTAAENTAAAETVPIGDEKTTVQQSSPVSVRSFHEETFELASGVGAPDKGSSPSPVLTSKHADKLTYQHERALRGFCTSASHKTAGAATAVCGPQPCSPDSHDDDDFVSQIMAYMVAFTNEVDKIGHSVSNMVTAAVAVPEEDVQEVLTVLSQEMDRSPSTISVKSKNEQHLNV